jgi:hypothetical protein
MLVQPQRLDWHGSFNRLPGQPMRDFFCHRRHDDWTEPDSLERLLLLADRLLPEPPHHRLDQSDNHHKPGFDWPVEQKRAPGRRRSPGLWKQWSLPAAPPGNSSWCSTSNLDRIAVLRPEQSDHHLPKRPHESGLRSSPPPPPRDVGSCSAARRLGSMSARWGAMAGSEISETRKVSARMPAVGAWLGSGGHRHDVQNGAFGAGSRPSSTGLV